MATHVMLDLETWGTGNKALIVSIGAVMFDAENILERFHVGVAPASAQAFGLQIDAGTIEWWLDPERDAARTALRELESADLPTALEGFDIWYKSRPEGADTAPAPIWGNGATFDNVILRSAYEATGAYYPAPFFLDRCYRSIKALAPEIKLERLGVHHSAVDDAESQARHLQALCKHLGVAL